MRKHSYKGFTLVEMLVAGSIATVSIGLTMSAFLYVLRIMYKDSQRLATNAILRNATSKIAYETVDASEVYVFPTYQSISSTVDVLTDVSAADATNTADFYGDCLVVVTKVSDVAAGSNIRQFRIFYRVVTAPSQDGQLRMYKSADYGESSTQTSLQTLLRAVNLNGNPRPSSSRVLAELVHGRIRPTSGSYPIFSTDSNVVTSAPQHVSINMEIINGTNVNTRLSSSSFNYTISPRK